MKKNIFTKIGAAAVVMTLITASLVGGTFAKYTTNVNASAVATAAKWQIAFKQGDTPIAENASITLQPTVTEGKAADTIVPGDKGEFIVKVDGTGTEVDFTYKISLAAAADNALGIKFYKEANHTTEITDAAPLTETIAVTDASKDKDVTIYWELPSGASDEADTAMAGKSAKFDITMLAEQKVPTTP